MSGHWALSLCVLFLAGCIDTHTSPELPASDEGPPSRDPFFAIESAAVTFTGKRAPTRTYFCSTSRRTSGLDASGNARYEYGLLRFRYSEREYAVEAGGEEVDFIVHVNDDAGEVAWAAWCHIPRSPASVERVLDRLGLAAHVSTEQVLARPSPHQRREPMGTEVQPMWGGGDDDEDDDRCGPLEWWDPEAEQCQPPIELPPVDDPVPPSPPPEDPDPWPWPDPDPEDPGGGGGGDHGGGGTPPEPPPPAEECEAGEECEEIEQPPPFDDLDDLDQAIPDCSDPEALKDRRIHAWCNGSLPDSTELGLLNAALDRIEERGEVCAQMAAAGRVLLGNQALKLFDWGAYSKEFAGAAPRGGDWLLITEQHLHGTIGENEAPAWYRGLDYALAHELGHHLGQPHLGDEGLLRYVTADTEQCSGQSILG